MGMSGAFKAEEAPTGRGEHLRTHKPGEAVLRGAVPLDGANFSHIHAGLARGSL